MSFIEFTFYVLLLVYAARHNFWLNVPWIKDNHSQPVDIKPTAQQNKVFDAWVQGVTHDKKAIDEIEGILKKG